MKNRLLRNYLITIAAAALLMAAVIAVDGGNIGFAGNWIRLGSDACFVSGVVLLVLAALTLVANGGGFYPFGYLGKRIQYTVTGDPDALMSYTDYVLSKRKAGKLNLTHLVVVGAALVALSLLLADL